MKKPTSDRKTFVDTNVLLYCLDSESPTKQAECQRQVKALCQQRLAHISVQVVKEYANNLVRKQRCSTTEASGLIADLRDFHVVRENVDSVHHALELMASASLSFWDACIIATAKSGGCGVLLTEDLSHGQVVDGIQIINPFA